MQNLDKNPMWLSWLFCIGEVNSWVGRWEIVNYIKMRKYNTVKKEAC
jgi:hypothetical protein